MSETPFNPAVVAPPALQVAREVLRKGGRIHLPSILLDQPARAIYDALQSAEWSTVLNGDGGNVFGLTAATIAALNAEQQERLLQAVHDKARDKFQFLYDAYRISDRYDEGAVTTGVLADFYKMLNSPAALKFFRELTGESRINYVDAQATRYRPGHFLTLHHDNVEGKNRLFAYVFNFTPTWRADWGGLLNFYDKDGHVAEAFTPTWNALNVLRVPQPHAVSYVAPFACGFRYSITGWMRSKAP